MCVCVYVDVHMTVYEHITLCVQSFYAWQF